MGRELAAVPWILAVAIAALAACADSALEPSTSASAPLASSGPADATATGADGQPPGKTLDRSGGALMRLVDGSRLYVADEDHRVLRIVRIPFEVPAPKPEPRHKPAEFPLIEPPPDAQSEEVAMPGAPAQVLPLDGHVLVTIGIPGLLLVMKESPDGKLSEEGRVVLPADAWGLAVTPDHKTAVVTSAWTHRVTGIDWAGKAVRWSLDVGREPRGVVVLPGRDTAYVSHLTSAHLTRIDGVSGASATAKVVELPAAPTRTPIGKTLGASLGYALVTDDAGKRVLASRHALGAMANDSWYGIPTIDVLQTDNDTPLLARREREKVLKSTPPFDKERRDILAAGADFYRAREVRPPMPLPEGVQPRAMIVSHRSKTIWVASEGDDSITELPLYGAAPAERPIRSLMLGRLYRDPKIFGEGSGGTSGIPGHCGAPSGLALSADEAVLYVLCRSTNDIVTIRVASADAKRWSWDRNKPDPAITVARLVPLGDEKLSRGRRLFYGARDNFSSGGMGCAGCHPEGRDDGHVWHEVITDAEKHKGQFLASESLANKTKGGNLGYPRQTPMLAGRVTTKGPFGWHGQNRTFADRMAEGFARHRWGEIDTDAKKFTTQERATVLAAFLKDGLVPPPKDKRELSALEQSGKTIFESERAECTKCHDPATQFTNYAIAAVNLPYVGAGFEKESDINFKTPSLLFVGGTAPYYHDGHAPTLDALVAQNADRMGKTSHLSASEKSALVAYLETL